MALRRNGFVTFALVGVSLIALYTAVRTPANATHTGSIIRNKPSGFVIDVIGARLNNGQPVILFSQNGGANQLYDLQSVDAEGQRFKIVARHSGKCLDVSGAAKQDGAPIIQWDCHGGPNQLWERVVILDKGPCIGLGCSPVGFAIRALHSGKCVDAANPKFPDPPLREARLQQWSCARDGGDPWWRNQVWDIEPLHPEPPIIH
jgi:hypothetical protein